MNPSTEDIVKAIEEVGAERVLILPNNKNIVMAARASSRIDRNRSGGRAYKNSSRRDLLLF